MHDTARVDALLAALDDYRPARQRLLAHLHLGLSNRDPLAEWSEQLVNALVGGRLATSRVQTAYDLTTPDGRRLQVRYLANPDDAWVNGHLVRTLPGVEGYALVIFVALQPVGVLLFPPDLTAICAALRKRHDATDVTLQLTRTNWHTIRDQPERFTALGMQLWLPPFGSASGTNPNAVT